MKQMIKAFRFVSFAAMVIAISQVPSKVHANFPVPGCTYTVNTQDMCYFRIDGKLAAVYGCSNNGTEGTNCDAVTP